MSTKIIKIRELKNFQDFSLGYGHFSTIHVGHIRYLKKAKSLSKKLVIALKGDFGINEEKSRYQFNQKERAEALSMLDLADAIILLKNDELIEVIKNSSPKFLVLGSQYENNAEKGIKDSISLLSKRGVSIIYHGGEISYFGSELLTSDEEEIKYKRLKEFKSACKRQSLNKENLLKSIESWGKANLIVIGDTIVDRYVACEALGISAEAPVVVVKEIENKDFVGGAAIVASHIKNLGAQCKLISVTGNDKNSKFIKERLSNEEIKDGVIIDHSRPTTFKKRYLVENQKLFRVTRLDQSGIDQKIEDQVIKELEISAKDASGIVISDFVYGVITEKIINKIHELAKKYNLLLFGDLQCSSQVGSIIKFKNFSFLSPNEREARIALHEKDLDLESLSNKIIRETNSKMLIMKLGSNGFIAYECNGKNIINQPYPALSINPVDVTGAGDSLLAVMAVGLSSAQNMMPTSAIACCMTALAVERMGNKPIRKEELINFIKRRIHF
tara:strand:- start:1431 stop:2933 length:1503 start_codon:yes stop_codon:yes gene_type:complete